MLPYVVLRGAGVAIGRGKEALWAVGGGSSNSAHGTPRNCLASGSDKHLTEVLKRNLGFVEVADGRVSRLHCIISLGPAGSQPLLEDGSSNGTFLNHRKLAKGESGRVSSWGIHVGPQESEAGVVFRSRQHGRAWPAPQTTAQQYGPVQRLQHGPQHGMHTTCTMLGPSLPLSSCCCTLTGPLRYMCCAAMCASHSAFGGW